jgi:hypothetical protein
MGANKIAIPKGTDSTQKLYVKDSAGAVVNITGATITLAVKRSADSKQRAYITKSSAVGAEITITDGPNGEADIYFVPADTQDQEPRIDKYDCRVRLASGKQYVIIENEDFEIEPAITEVIP